MYVSTPLLWPALFVFLALALPMIVTDASEHRLPLSLNLGLMGAAAVLLPVASIWIGADHLISAGISCVIATIFMLGLFILARGGLGFGDVILVAGLSLYSGMVSPLVMLGGLWIGCLGTLCWYMVRRRRGIEGPVPFGPGLIFGTLAVMLIPLP